MRPARPSVCVALYAASLAVLLESHLGHGWGFVDLAVYRHGGEAALDGAHLYALRFPGDLAFTYPPVAALAFTSLTVTRPAVSELAVTAASIVLLPAMLYFALRLQPLRSWLPGSRAMRLALLASAGAIWLEPVWTTLRYGQIDVLIATLVLYDLSRPDPSRWKGVGIGLASALKLTPAIFVLYLLLTRRSRAAGVALAVFCGTIAVGFAALPGDSWEYWSGAFIDSGRVGRIENAANQSLRGGYARLLHSLNVDAVWLCTAAVVALAGMALAVRAGRSSHDRRGDDVKGFSLCALTGLLVSPISWSHHWTLAVPALLLLAVGAHRRASTAGLAAAVAVAFVACSHLIWWVPINRPPHSELHLKPLQLLYSDAYVLIGLGALALAAWEAIRACPRSRNGNLLRLIGAARGTSHDRMLRARDQMSGCADL
jgi:alpha-1,2-mannosyltransferase